MGTTDTYKQLSTPGCENKIWGSEVLYCYFSASTSKNYANMCKYKFLWNGCCKVSDIFYIWIKSLGNMPNEYKRVNVL
jgi:hypothetical protein